jgi:hypothetical protein
VALVIEKKEEELGEEEEEEDKEERKGRKKQKKKWGGDGNTNVKFHNTSTVSSKFTWTSLELAKLGRIGSFTKFVIALG